MKQVVAVKLLPDGGARATLTATLHACNEAANRLSELAYRGDDTPTRAHLQRLAHSDLKDRGLSAQPALHVLRKVADAYTALRAHLRAGNLGKPGSKRHRKAESKPLQFRPDAAQPFDDRCLSWQLDAGTVSIWTVHGRIKGIRFAGGADQLKTLREHRKGETEFRCRSCGVVAHADRNASRNIAARGETAWAAGRESRVPAPS